VLHSWGYWTPSPSQPPPPSSPLSLTLTASRRQGGQPPSARERRGEGTGALAGGAAPSPSTLSALSTSHSLSSRSTAVGSPTGDGGVGGSPGEWRCTSLARGGRAAAAHGGHTAGDAVLPARMQGLPGAGAVSARPPTQGHGVCRRGRPPRLRIRDLLEA
jgi:hypothetical protein